MSLRESVVERLTRVGVRVGFELASRYRRTFRQIEPDDDHPWFGEYTVFDVPETLEPYPEIPGHEFLYRTARDNPDEGLIQRGVTVTYPEILGDAERLATALADRGVEPGDRVATILPTSVQFAVVDAAISIAGAVHVPNDFLDATEDLEYRLETAEASVLVGHDVREDLLFELAESAGIDDLVLTDVDDYSANPPSHEPRPDAEWLPDVIDAASRDPPEVVIDPAQDVKVLMFTGGTTGRPKGVQLTHGNVVANVLQADSLSGSTSFLEGTALVAQPMYHAYGYTTLQRGINDGHSLALVDDARDVERMSRLIDDHDIRLISGVPTQFMELLEENVDKNLIALSGSAPLASEVKSEFESNHLGITQGYGLSEMTAVTHVDLRGLIDSLAGTQTADDTFEYPCVGIPIPDTEVKLVDVDTDEEIPMPEAVREGREGELYLNGPQRMLGYLDRPDPFDDEGFIATGDVVKVDPSGRFYVVDRVKNMVNVSGLKVYTEEVDEVLYDLDGVRRPATVGVPDPERPGSERVKIYVEPEADADPSEATVRDHLAGRVADHAMPIAVEFVDELPLTDVGKVDKQALKERHAASTTPPPENEA